MGESSGGRNETIVISRVPITQVLLRASGQMLKDLKTQRERFNLPFLKGRVTLKEAKPFRVNEAKAE